MTELLAKRSAADAYAAQGAARAGEAAFCIGRGSAVEPMPPWELSGVQLAVVAGERLLVNASSVRGWTGRVGGRGFVCGATAPGIGAVNGRGAPAFGTGKTLTTLSVPGTVGGATLWRDGSTPVLYAPTSLFLALAFATGESVAEPSKPYPEMGLTALSVTGCLALGIWNGPRLYARVINAAGTPVLVGGHELSPLRTYVAELTLEGNVLRLRVDGAEYSEPFGEPLYASGGPAVVLGGGAGADWDSPIGMVAIGSSVPSEEDRLRFHAWCVAELGDAPSWSADPTPTPTVVPGP